MLTPIKAISTRIKSPEKVVDKIIRKPNDYPEGLSKASILNMPDTIGVRIIIFFLSNLPHLDSEIRNSKILNLSKIFTPEAYLPKDLLSRLGLSHIKQIDKESGYCSIHYCTVFKSSKHSPIIEIQVRTLAQEFWSEMEHLLSYKSEMQSDFLTKRKFKIMSKEINAIDEHFNILYDEFLFRQKKAKFSGRDRITSENLPAILSEFNLRCTLLELREIVKILNSRKIKYVNEFMDLATPGRIEMIRNHIVSKLGFNPSTAEVLTILISMKDIKANTSDIRHIIKQISLYGWH
ncbi:hypothetical protein ACFL7D_07745 [candidate division KSB1 bacterium]